MFRLIKRILQLAFLFLVIALIFNWKYKGVTSRDYAKQYGEQFLNWVGNYVKQLEGKNLEELLPQPVKQWMKGKENTDSKAAETREGGDI